MSGLGLAQTEPWSVVDRLNTAWRSNQLEVLPSLFDEEAVIVDGMHRPLAIGRAACVESYRAFVTTAAVEAYAEGRPTVALFGGTAVVSYSFQIRYSISGQPFDETGSDCFLLTRGPSGWLVVWRQLVRSAAYPAHAADGP